MALLYTNLPYSLNTETIHRLFPHFRRYLADKGHVSATHPLNSSSLSTHCLANVRARLRIRAGHAYKYESIVKSISIGRFLQGVSDGFTNCTDDWTATRSPVFIGRYVQQLVA